MLLGQLQSEQRREVLEEMFSQHQRLALEQWILSKRQSHETAPKRPVAKASQAKLQIECTAKRRSSITGADAARPIAKGEPVEQRVAGKGTPLHTAPSLRLPGLIRNPQSNGCYYFAEIALDNLRLLSRADRDLSVVMCFHRVLSEIREKTLSMASDSLEDRFRLAVAAVLQGHAAFDARAAGLRFIVSLRPLWAARPLCTLAYSLSDSEELETGLAARTRLMAARGCVKRRSHVLWSQPLPALASAWQNFRDAYLEVMAERGCGHGVVSKRLDAVEAEQRIRQERQLEAWNRAQMAREERQQAQADRQRIRAQRHAAVEDRALRAVKGLLRRWAAREARLQPGPQLKRRRQGVLATAQCASLSQT